jgi:hypothetical protein
MYTLKQLQTNDAQAEINGKWVPARPIRFFGWGRLREAWAVLRGKADAFTWPEGQ